MIKLWQVSQSAHTRCLLLLPRAPAAAGSNQYDCGVAPAWLPISGLHRNQNVAAGSPALAALPGCQVRTAAAAACLAALRHPCHAPHRVA